MDFIRQLLGKIGFEVDHKGLDRAEKHLEGIKERLDILAAAEIAKKLFEMGERFGELGERLTVASTSAGISVESFQKLAYAAQQSAVGQEEMETAMARLSKNLFQARHGSEGAKKAFRLAGLTGEQVRGFQNSQQALEALADRFQNIQDPVKKAALAQELMGRGSIHMVGFLSKGSAAIRAQGNEAEKLGLILGGRQVEALEELSKSFHKFWALINQIGAVIASQIAPVFTFLIDDTLKWFKANRDVIGLNIKTFLQNFAYGLGFVYGLVKALVGGMISLAKSFHIEGSILKIIALFAGFASAAFAVIKVVRLIGLAVSILSSPILAVAAAIGAIVVAAHDLYALFKGGDTWIGSALKSLTGFASVGDFFGKAAEAVTGGGATPGGPIPYAAMAGMPGLGGESNTQSNTITQTTHAPIVQNIYGGNPKEMARAAQAGVDGNMARARRETLRGLQGPVAQ